MLDYYVTLDELMQHKLQGGGMDCEGCGKESKTLTGKQLCPSCYQEMPSVELLRRALAFYIECPDGQYDYDVVVPLLVKEIRSRDVSLQTM